MAILCPSILSADFSNLQKELETVQKAGVTHLHMDVMDGHFVPNITIGPLVVKSLRPVSDLVFDVHLMIENPGLYIEAFAKAGADIINFHIEASEDPLGMINEIKRLGKKCAVTLKPATPVDTIKHYLPFLDMVLIMSVEPGFGGQKIMSSTLDKVRLLKRIKEEDGLYFDIEVDGGVDLDNVSLVLSAGVDIVVAGTAVFGAEDTVKAVQKFHSIFERYR